MDRGTIHVYTHVPALQAPHVDIPVQSEEHDYSEYEHAKHTEDTHHKTKYHVEEEEEVGEDLIEPTAWVRGKQNTPVTCCNIEVPMLYRGFTLQQNAQYIVEHSCIFQSP